MSQTKICVRCETDHPIEFFNWKSKKNKRRTGVCKECTREYARNYYRDNPDKMKSNSRRSNKRRIKNVQEKYYYFLLENPCVDCGESDPVVLDPDHDRDKKYNVSKMIRHGHCWSRIVEELDKCTIRCANCHRRKTAKEQNWRKVELADAGGRQASHGGS